MADAGTRERPRAADGALPGLARASVAGMGVALPPLVVPNAEVAARLGVDAAWIERRTGIRERRHAAPGSTLVDLAVAAGREALADAGLAAAELDLVLVATATSDQILPNAAPLVAHQLGAHRAGAVDVGAACAGFVAAMALGASWVESMRGARVLVIGAEILSRHLDLDDPVTAPLFGDGAGAVVLRPTAGAGVGASVLGCDATRADSLTIDHASGRLRMDGPSTFRAATEALAAVCRETAEKAGWAIDAVDLFVFHQANSRILAAVGSELGLGADRVIDVIAATGNTSAASVPLALSAARTQGRLRPGDRLMLAAVGAGFTWAGLALEWPEPDAGPDPALSAS
jgi:3-oxoacyl-[acyl-carrier-protein] synthase-3